MESTFAPSGTSTTCSLARERTWRSVAPVELCKDWACAAETPDLNRTTTWLSETAGGEGLWSRDHSTSGGEGVAASFDLANIRPAATTSKRNNENAEAGKRTGESPIRLRCICNVGSRGEF